MPDVLFTRFFSEALTADDACDRIEAEIAALKIPKSKRNQVWQRVLKDAATAYLGEARAATNKAKKWRSIAEAMFWWASAFSVLTAKPFCQNLGADKNRTKAEESALSAVRAWRGDPVNARSMSKLSDAEVTKRYLRQRGLARRQADKLRAMLRDGRIK